MEKTKQKTLILLGIVIFGFLSVACVKVESTTTSPSNNKKPTLQSEKVEISLALKKAEHGLPDKQPASGLPTKNPNGPANVPEGYAVISGISDYPGTANDLQYSDDDAADVYNLVLNTFHVPSTNIVRLLNSQATTGAITSAITSFASVMDVDDTLFFYDSGHGSSAEQIDSYSWSVQSSHPYSNNMDYYWHYSVPGVNMMRVHFVRITTETNYDGVFVGDNADRGSYWDLFTGSYSNVWSNWVMTDDIYVNLYTDSSYTYWGFQVDRVETSTWVAPQEFIPYDGLTDGFTGPELDALLDTVPGKVITVLDTCFSGGVGSAIQATGRYSMTACQWNELSLEDSAAYNGAFTRYFLVPWTSTYDTNADGVVAFEETFSYISTNTISRSTAIGSVHHPQQYDNIAGSTIFQPNAKINSNTVDGSFNTSVNFFLNGLGWGELLCAYYDKNTQTYKVQCNDSSVMPSASAISRTIAAPGGFTTSAVTTIVNARYGTYVEQVNSSVNVSGLAFSSGTDSDGDGVSDLAEFNHGTNPWNVDSDGDGMRDSYEIQYFLDPFFDDSEFDPDGDSIPNINEYLNGLNPLVANNFTDKDNDGLYDLVEYNISSNISNPDTDGDGMQDGWEYTYAPTVNIFVPDAGLDPDGDGLVNYHEYQHLSNPGSADSDADGMPDGWEHVYGLNLIVNDANGDKDSDGGTNLQEFNAGSNATNVDTDGDGMRDGWEITFASTVNVLVPDNGSDPDGDGLVNYHEYQHLSNPGSADSDSDGMTDGWEHVYGLNLIVNDANGDKDYDGGTNIQEFNAGSNATNVDTDGDGMRDGWEITFASTVNVLVPDNGSDPDGDGLVNYHEYQHLSNPGSADSDSDGMTDGWEHVYGLNLIVNDANGDKDYDGGTNIQEFNAGSNATNVDTDGDGMRDGWEITFASTVNVLVPDNGSDPDGDGLANINEYQHSSNPGSTDSDGDGMPDAWEHTYGMVLAMDDSLGDLDRDGLTNYREYATGANPTIIDSDWDGLDDYLEYTLGSKPNNLESDGDGFGDYQEYTMGSDPGNASDTPLLHIFAFFMIIALVVIAVISAKQRGKKHVYPRPRTPGPRPSALSKYTPGSQMAPSRQPYGDPTGYSRPSYSSPSPRVYPQQPTIVLPYQIQRQLDALPFQQRELVKAMFIQKIQERLEEERRASYQQPVQKFCIKCGGVLISGRCIRCGYIPPYL